MENLFSIWKLVYWCNFRSKDQLTKKKERIIIKDLISNNWKYKTKEAKLILQSGIYNIFYQYFGRHGLPSSGSSVHIMIDSLFTDSWNWQSFVSSNLLTVFLRWIYKMNTSAVKNLLLFMAGVFIGFLVEKCTAWEKRNRKSSFSKISFASYFTLLDAWEGSKVLSNSGLTR